MRLRLQKRTQEEIISFAFPEHSCEICLDLKKYDFRKFELTAKINTDNNISRDIRLFKK